MSIRGNHVGVETQTQLMFVFEHHGYVVIGRLSSRADRPRESNGPTACIHVLILNFSFALLNLHCVSAANLAIFHHSS